MTRTEQILKHFDKAIEATECKFQGSGGDDIAAQKEINEARRWIEVLLMPDIEDHPLVQVVTDFLKACHKNLDEKPWPQKYGVPYGEVVKMTEVLNGMRNVPLGNAPVRDPEPTPPSTWDEWAMAKAKTVEMHVSLYPGAHNRHINTIHVALIEAMRFAKGQQP